MHYYKAEKQVSKASRSLWSVEERESHINVFELKAAKLAVMYFTLKGKGCNISWHPHGQYNSPVILNENGGCQKLEVNCDQEIYLAIPFENKDHDYCLVFTRVNECRGR